MILEPKDFPKLGSNVRHKAVHPGLNRFSRDEILDDMLEANDMKNLDNISPLLGAIAASVLIMYVQIMNDICW